MDAGGEESVQTASVFPRNWSVLLLLAAAGGCSGSTSGTIYTTGDLPPFEGEVREGELREITPLPGPITPISAIETPVPSPTPKPK